MALALEKWDLHKRLALRILSHLGGSPFKYYVVLCWLLFYPCGCLIQRTMMMLPIVFSYRSFGRNAWGAKLRKFDTVGWHMDALLAEYISGNPPNLSLSGF
jgi:sodium-dependent dicarboxylate transporter 2/3/5